MGMGVGVAGGCCCERARRPRAESPCFSVCVVSVMFWGGGDVLVVLGYVGGCLGAAGCGPRTQDLVWTQDPDTLPAASLYLHLSLSPSLPRLPAVVLPWPLPPQTLNPKPCPRRQQVRLGRGVVVPGGHSLEERAVLQRLHRWVGGRKQERDDGRKEDVNLGEDRGTQGQGKHQMSVGPQRPRLLQFRRSDAHSPTAAAAAATPPHPPCRPLHTGGVEVDQDSGVWVRQLHRDWAQRPHCPGRLPGGHAGGVGGGCHACGRGGGGGWREVGPPARWACRAYLLEPPPRPLLLPPPPPPRLCPS